MFLTGQRECWEHISVLWHRSTKKQQRQKERDYDRYAFPLSDAAAFSIFEEPYITPNKYHKMFIEKWYLVLYQIQDDTVYVEYILDCRKDYSWLIR